MNRSFLSVPLLALFFIGCAIAGDDSESDRRGAALGKADFVGSCAGSCDGPSAAGDCWCDDLCSTYGDCCPDVASECGLDECKVDFETNTQSGCGYGQYCLPGVCLLWCPAGDDSCCAPNTCAGGGEPEESCEALGGQCLSSPIDVTFPALCAEDFGMDTVDGACPAINQTCCVPALTCEALGGQCLSSPIDVTFGALCEQDYGMATADGTCPAFNQSCCVP
jgi:hypothetical protein